MKYVLIAALLALSGCIQGCADTLKLPDNNAVGCSKLVRPWGTFVVTVANGEKGAANSPNISVDDNCKMTVTAPTK